jgi:hypothetical protein
MGIELVLEMACAMDADRVAIGRRLAGMTVAELADVASGGASVLADHGARTLAFLGTNGAAWPVSLFSDDLAHETAVGSVLALTDQRSPAGEADA